MARYHLNHQAAIELSNIVATIADDSPRHASLVYAAFLQAFQAIAEQPRMAPLSGEDSSLRRLSGRKKLRSYFVYYEIVEGVVEILRVVHTARDQPSALDDSQE